MFYVLEPRGTGAQMLEAFENHSKKSLKSLDLVESHLGTIAETYKKSKE